MIPLKRAKIVAFRIIRRLRWKLQCRFQTRNIGDGVSVALGGGRDGSSPIALGLRYNNVIIVLNKIVTLTF